MLHCDLRVRWKVASDLRFRAAISGPKTLSFCRISGDLASSTRKSLTIAIVRFWCAKEKHFRDSPARPRKDYLLLPLFRSGREVCFGPSRPDPERSTREEDGTRTWTGPGPDPGEGLDGTPGDTNRLLGLSDFPIFRETQEINSGLVPGLVAQCSAVGVSVAATPQCSAIRFGKELLPRHSERGVAR